MHGEPLPFRFVFRYGQVRHDDGSTGLMCLGFGIEQREDPIGRDLSDADNVTRPVITDLAKRWDKLEQVARINLEAQLGSGEAPEGGFRRGVRTRRRRSRKPS